MTMPESRTFRFLFDYNGNWKWLDLTFPQEANLAAPLKRYIGRLSDQIDDGFVSFDTGAGVVLIDMRHVLAIIEVNLFDGGFVSVQPHDTPDMDNHDAS